MKKFIPDQGDMTDKEYIKFLKILSESYEYIFGDLYKKKTLEEIWSDIDDKKSKLGYPIY